jgi:GT2 family glycosyltransferase
MKDAKPPFVIIIVTNFNGLTTYYKGKPIIEVCLKSLRKTDYKNYKVFVADGSSADKSVSYIKKKFSEVDITKDNINIGFTKSCNKAMKYAIKRYKPKYLVLFNNDLIVTNGNWLRELINIAENRSDVGLVGCKLLYPNGSIQHAGSVIGIAPYNRGRAEKDVGQYDKIEDLEAVTGAVLLIKKDVIDRIGYFDENFFIGYEDMDYCIRSREAGFKIVYDGNVSLIHLEGSTTTDSKDSSRKELFMFTGQRNYIYFALKHFTLAGRIKAILIAIGGSVFSIESKNRSRRITNLRFKDRPFLRLWKTLQAIVAAYSMYNKKGFWWRNYLKK